MRTYNRVFGYIERSRKDFKHKQSIHEFQNRVNNESIIICQLEIAAKFLNEAITRMERK